MVVVRVPENDEVVLTTALDAGASAIVMPHTESAEEVKEMIQKMYYRKYWLRDPSRLCREVGAKGNS